MERKLPESQVARGLRDPVDSRFEERPDAETAFPEEVRQTASALLELLKATRLSPDLAATLRATCEGVSRRLSGTRLTLALVGEAGAGRRTLINALLGERVLATGTPRRGSTVTIVRHAPTLGFTARSLDGRRVAELRRKLPDRDALFQKSMQQLRRELTAKEEIASRLQVARMPHPAPGTPGAAEPRPPIRSWLVALWSWILHVWVWLQRKQLPPHAREAPPPPQSDDVPALEHDLADTPHVEPIAARMDRLREEQEKYESERRAVFLAQVRDFDGTDIAERIVDYPATWLANGLTLVDLPSPTSVNAPTVGQVCSRVACEVDALVLVSDIDRPPGVATATLVRELRRIAPLVLVLLTKADMVLLAAVGPKSDVTSKIPRGARDACDRVARALGGDAEKTPCVAIAAGSAVEAPGAASPLAEHFRTTMGQLSDRLRDERPFILAWREAMRLRVGAAELTRTWAADEESCRKRLRALESKRIPDPAEFRGKLLIHVADAIEKGADDVLAGAIRYLHAEMERLRAEWQGQISPSTTRNEVDVRVSAINESAPKRIAEALEGTVEQVARELHNVTETLETWAIEEIHTHYRLVRRLGGEALSPVASELTREDLEQELRAAQPVEGAMDAFEKQRVGYGLGGVAAGAVLGSLIAPGIGTAIGAVLGVLAGLLKGLDSLKQECIAKIEACLKDAESHAHSQLLSKRPDLSRVIRVALDEALEEALSRLNDAIARLRAIERNAIDGERLKLEELIAARRTLDECDARLTRLIAAATVRLT